MSGRRADAFTAVVGAGRGGPDGRQTPRVLTDLDRARELLPLIGAVLTGTDVTASVIALRHRADDLGIDVIHGVFRDADDSVEQGLTLLLSSRSEDELLGVVELDTDGSPRLLRPDQPRWNR